VYLPTESISDFALIRNTALTGAEYLGESVSRTAIRFHIESFGEAKGDLVRFLAPRTVEALLHAMPIHGITATTKGMLYFGVPVKLGVEKPKTQVDQGTIAYWPLGSAVCIVLERTNPYSPVNVIGKLTENLEMFRRAESGKRVRMERG